MTDERAKLGQEKIDVVLRDLDALLRKKFGDHLIVDSFTTSSLVPPGENYGSSMLKVEVIVRRDGPSSEQEKLSLVAKMVPPTELQRKMFDSPFTFRKEMNMFKVIGPAYKALERECGIPESEVFDILPNFYGARLSLNEAEDTFDHDAVILMENLKVKNYACLDRMIGVDLAHSKFLVGALARFHALGVAMKLKKPELFKVIKEHAKSVGYDEEMPDDDTESVLAILKKSALLLPHLDRIEKALSTFDTEAWTKEPDEPWGTIAHTDLWVNNIMFRDDADGNPEDVKFVDFQNYLYVNPMLDLVFFIVSSCERNVQDMHMDDLVDLYYEKFISHLVRLECDVTLFSRESFDEQFEAAAKVEYLHCMFMTRVVNADTQKDLNMSSPEQLFSNEIAEECGKRMIEITMQFVEKNWL
ncbi:uncharacterized protein LOC124412352 [Diprion similis]|uniref:uncharacterized protein LOC124412352 n=1 Tax=Diprion similis TaxID=362088 RepID=UPI001EF7C140|nr:uncharacterized protein LOC124412352 [Diprion similis]